MARSPHSFLRTTGLLLAVLCLAAPAATLTALGTGCAGAKKLVKDDAMEKETLRKAATIYWEGVRWGDADRSSAFIQDSDLRVAFSYWLEDEQEERRISDVAIMQIEMGPEIDPPREGREREATVHLRIEGYELPAQIVDKRQEEQLWYRTQTGWYAEWTAPTEED